VAGVNDLIRMKLPPVAARTSTMWPRSRAVAVRARSGALAASTRCGRLPAHVDRADALALLAGRAVEGDPTAQVWLSQGGLHLEASREDLSEEHLRSWVAGMHDRLLGAQLAGTKPDVRVSDDD